jgi:hypothetical protein
MSKLCPREVEVSIYSNEAHIVLALHLLGLGLWMFRVFHYFSIINSHLEPHYNTVQRHVAATSLVRDKLLTP